MYGQNVTRIDRIVQIDGNLLVKGIVTANDGYSSGVGIFGKTAAQYYNVMKLFFLPIALRPR